MRRHHLYSFVLPFLALGASTALMSDTKAQYSAREKAFYADSALVSFVRPGLMIKVTGVDIATDGTVKAKVKLTDPKGMPLDRDGIMTPGAVSCSFVLARIPNGATQYVAYTTRVQTSPITGVRATQAGADSGGVWTKVADGEYTYTLATKLPSGYEKNVTHTIGAYGSRNLTEFDLGTNYDDDVYNFVPDGTAVKTTRDVIKTATCNQCHLDMGFHGGSRKTMEVCVLCHTPQTIDPDTGNSVDMSVMTHKIHMGAELPSVVAGTPYKIIGNAQSVHDYSEIEFPADPRSCLTCHDQKSGAAQAGNVYKANRAACGACHDNIKWDTGLNHGDFNLPQSDDKDCVRCHAGKSDSEFNTSVEGAHVIPRFSKELKGVVLDILEVSGNAPGKNVTVVFTVKDKMGTPIPASKMTRLTAILSGPNTDYTYYLSESALNAGGVPENGLYWWTFTQPLAANAKGSWTVSLEGRIDTTLQGGFAKGTVARDTAENKQFYFSVDGTPVQARRKVVDIAKCNVCHAGLALHGEARNMSQECVICHNPARTAGTGAAATSIEFATMVHKIHRGSALTRGYKIGTADFSSVGYPGDLRSCESCHIAGTQQLPLADTTIAVLNPSEFVTTQGRTTAACLACHDTKAAAAHAASTTDPTVGEACATCHGPDAEKAVSKVHAR